MVASALTFSIMNLFVKFIGDNASTDFILFARFFFSLVCILPWVLKNPKEIVRVKQPLKLILRSVCSLIALGTLFYSLKLIPLGNALVLNNTFPLFIPLAAWAFHKIKTPHKMWLGIAIGFVGVVLVLHPSASVFHLGSIMGLLSGIFAALALYIVRFMTKEIHMGQILFYNFLINSAISGAIVPFYWKPLSGNTWLLLLGVAVFGFLYQGASTLGLAKAPARMTSPLMYLCIVFGVVADYFFWGITPEFWSCIGILLIIGGGIATIFFGKKEMPQTSKRFSK